jgi:hypothetical protein
MFVNYGSLDLTSMNDNNTGEMSNKSNLGEAMDDAKSRTKTRFNTLQSPPIDTDIKDLKTNHDALPHTLSIKNNGINDQESEEETSMNKSINRSFKSK